MTTPSRRGFAAALTVGLAWWAVPGEAIRVTKPATSAPRPRVELNETARFVYDRFVESRCPERVASELSQAYDVDAGLARRDTDACLAQFRAMGLIV